MPLARATGSGSTFDCADHSNSVCLRDSAIISSPVIVFFKVSVAIYVSRLSRAVPPVADLLLEHLLAHGPEFVAGFPLRELVGLRDAVTDGQQHLQIFARAVEIPARQHDVLGRVIPVLGKVVAYLLRIVRRLTDVVDPG